MKSKVATFFKTGPKKALLTDSMAIRRLYESKRWSVFISVTLGYAFFYVTRLSLSVVKKPMLEEGIINTHQMGIIGSVLLATYAFGKFFNGFLADGSNIRRFMSFGLLMSAGLNILFGMTNSFPLYVLIWGLNGWFLSMGSAPSVVSLSQWFSHREMGTRYGIWFISHSIGEGITFAGTSILVSQMGWRWGFYGPGVVSVLVAFILFRTLADRPRTYGLPSVADYKKDHVSKKPTKQEMTSLLKMQLEIFKYPVVWILGLASALTYVSRYAVNNWGILYLQDFKGYSLNEAGAIMSIAPIMGIPGGILCGVISDRFFKSSRNWPTLVYGILQILSLVVFFYAKAGRSVDMISMGVFGFSVAGTVVFLGGLTAVDLCPKRVTGAVMGFIGLFSYLGASIQDYITGYLLDVHKIVIHGKTVPDFNFVIVFWVGASLLSMILACSVWNAKPQE
ncbi:MAG: MFS transporter [Bdellovibrionota bacterium]